MNIPQDNIDTTKRLFILIGNTFIKRILFSWFKEILSILKPEPSFINYPFEKVVKVPINSRDYNGEGCVNPEKETLHGSLNLIIF